MNTSTTGQPGATPAGDLLSRVDSSINTILSYLSSMWIFAIMVLICVDVAMRTFFNSPIAGVAEFVAASVVALVFLQLPGVIARRRLLRAEMFIEPFEARFPRAAALLDAVYAAIGILMFWRIVGWAIPDMIKAWNEGTYAGAQGVYEIPLWPFNLAVVIGTSFGLLQFVRHVLTGLARSAGVTGTGTGGASISRDGAPPGGPMGFAIALAIVMGMVSFCWLVFTADLSPSAVGIWCLVAMLAMVALGMPIPLALLALSYVGVWVARQGEFMAINTLGLAASSAIYSYEFGVVPLFIMMGVVLEKADVGHDAFKVTATLLRRMRGGLGLATVFANAIFASIVGSSIASAAVFTRIAVPPMVEHGYSKRFSVGCVAGSSVLGMLIPPSLLLIIFGLVAEESVGKLFIAAVVPGILLAIVFCIGIWLMATFTPRFVGNPRTAEDMEAASAVEILVKLAPIIMLVVAVIGGIYGGFFTPTEAAATGCLFAFVIALARRRIGWRTFREILLETGFVSAVILFLIVAANLYTRQVALTGIPTMFAGWVEGAGLKMVGFLAIYFLAVLLLGMIIDSVSIILIMLPIMLPVLLALGGDKVWFGVVTTIVVEIGLLTPPFGLAVYVVKSVLPKDYASLITIFAGSIPFVFMMMLVSLLVMAFPQLSLWLTRL
jgi:tripartite ATP-independent transporter DctM subunit